MYSIETLAVHGARRRECKGEITEPIFLSTAYEGGNEYSYSRISNPTRDSLQEQIAALEKARFGVMFASGMAAVNAVLLLAGENERAVISRDCYGGTARLADRILSRHGTEPVYVDPRDTCETARALEGAKVFLAETPSNPMLRCCDIRKLSELCRYNGVIFALDNTFMTPFLQSPITLGADIVIHSATKFLCGHHDACGGAAVTNDEELYEHLKLISGTCGSMLSPFDCFMIQRGIKTLHLRMPRHCEAAKRAADVLRAHPSVKEVFYPDDDRVNMKQAASGGAMVSFRLADGTDPEKVLKKGTVIRFGESLGGAASLITHPYSQTHASLPKEQKDALGITYDLMRFSPGLEDIDDILTDLLYMLAP